MAMARLPAAEDDFGKARPWYKGRANGQLTPRHCIGSTIAQVLPEKEIKFRHPELSRSGLDSTFCAIQAAPERRLKMAILDSEGIALSSQRPSSGSERPHGLRQISGEPAKQKNRFDTSKRCFEWTHRPTAFDNTDTWEEPVVPGVRPSHPVCIRGPVGVEHMRSFPEKQNQATGVPPPCLAKAPHGAEWGGWGASGAPGRAPMQSPWDSLEPKDPSKTEAEVRFCDARTRRFPHMKDTPTFVLTAWHLDARRDVDPASAKKIHVNVPTASTAAAARRPVGLPAAGRAGGFPSEGASMPWYEKVRLAELSSTGQPHTAR